jgi:glucose/arabinose dehydrogenase
MYGPGNGSPTPGNPLSYNLTDQTGNVTRSEVNTLSSYFSYDIRNRFSLAIDPVTGNFWDTEIGAAHYDQINLVKPGFNSG